MKTVLFGATGMVGQGVLRECLLAANVTSVTAVGRTATGMSHPKLSELIVKDLFDVASYREKLACFDACFYCLGVSSAGMTEEAYAQLTYELTLKIAEELARINPAMTFIYVSGMGTDSSEQGRTMWARVKGKLENALLRLPFRSAYMFRPGMILPMHGIQSKTRSYRILYSLLKPVSPLLRWAFPRQVLTTEQVGLAMLAAVRKEPGKEVLEARDIHGLLDAR